MKTCVLPFSRRNGFEWRMRSRSRWKGVRSRHSLLARAAARLVRAHGERREPVLLVLANARLEGVGDLSGELRHGQLEDDRDGAAVGAPGRAGDVAGALGAEEDDHRGDLLRLREPAERAARCRPPASTSSRVLPVRAACWSASPPSASQASVAVGPGVTALQRIPSPA